jgi:hypothetical protein
MVFIFVGLISIFNHWDMQKTLQYQFLAQPPGRTKVTIVKSSWQRLQHGYSLEKRREIVWENWGKRPGTTREMSFY